MARRDWLWGLGVCAVVIAIVHSAPLKAFYNMSDPRGTLLTSQAIVRHGTVRLDAYAPQLRGYGYRVIEIRGHLYYSYPLGTAVFSIPFVWAANLLGRDFANPETDAKAQNVMSTATVAAAFLLILLICRRFLPLGRSLGLAATFVLGTSIASSMGVALWNLNLEVLFLLAAVYLVAREETGGTPWRATPYVLGLLAFSACFCRLTAASFVLALLGYLLWKGRMRFLGTFGTFALLFLGYAAFLWHEYGQILPPRYSPAALAAAGYGKYETHFWLALYGNLASPARGVLVYSPFVLLTLAGLAPLVRNASRRPLAALAGAWLVLHLAVLCWWPVWWGGWSYGTRLLTDALPALLILTILTWEHAAERFSAGARRRLGAVFAVLAAWSVFVNVYGGLHNTFTARWNARPNIDENPQYLFSWKYAQFLATPAMIERRNAEHETRMQQGTQPADRSVTPGT